MEEYKTKTDIFWEKLPEVVQNLLIFIIAFCGMVLTIGFMISVIIAFG